MGPALLPTPLSPMRGLVRRRELGIRCFSLLSVRKRSSGSVTGARTGIRIHPPISPVRSRRGRSHSLTFPSRPSTGGSAARPSVNGRSLERLHHHPVRRPFCDASLASDRVGPARNGMLRVSVIDPPCVWPKPSARGSRKSRGQISLRLSGSEFPKSFRSLDLLDRKLSSPFRWIKAAPDRPILQACKTRVIHFPPNLLWTEVDKSTVRRNFRKASAGNAQFCASCTRSHAITGRAWPAGGGAGR